jgi:hypothetical protein
VIGGEPPGPGRNGEHDFHGERPSNEMHASATDPDARMARQSNGQAARLCYRKLSARPKNHAQRRECCAGAVDQHPAQVLVVAFADPQQLGLATCDHLFRYQPQLFRLMEECVAHFTV